MGRIPRALLGLGGEGALTRSLSDGHVWAPALRSRPGPRRRGAVEVRLRCGWVHVPVATVSVSATTRHLFGPASGQVLILKRVKFLNLGGHPPEAQPPIFVGKVLLESISQYTEKVGRISEVIRGWDDGIQREAARPLPASALQQDPSQPRSTPPRGARTRISFDDELTAMA